MELDSASTPTSAGSSVVGLLVGRELVVGLLVGGPLVVGLLVGGSLVVGSLVVGGPVGGELVVGGLVGRSLAGGFVVASVSVVRVRSAVWSSVSDGLPENSVVAAGGVLPSVCSVGVESFVRSTVVSVVPPDCRVVSAGETSASSDPPRRPGRNPNPAPRSADPMTSVRIAPRLVSNAEKNAVRFIVLSVTHPTPLRTNRFRLNHCSDCYYHLFHHL